jgi:hypothetical protein
VDEGFGLGGLAWEHTGILERWEIEHTCCAINLDTWGSQCPSELTAMPAVKSRYFRFSISHR